MHIVKKRADETYKSPNPPVNEVNEKTVTATMPRMKPRACRSIVETAELQVTHT
jgi:hypothetical protein